MNNWNTYLIPQSLSEAFTQLKTHEKSCYIVAGGTDLLLEIEQEHRPTVEALVDVTGIPELNKLEVRDKELFIGAAVPLKKIASSSLVQTHAQALAESTGQIGGPQVRAVGTLGGNVGHALPAGDGAISLLALEAFAEVATEGAIRRIPLADLYKGPGESTLQQGKELIVGFYIPLTQTGQASAFSRVMRPQGVALPVINMAMWIETDGIRIKRSRLAVGPAGPVPQRAYDVESILCEQEWNDLTVENAVMALHDCIHFRSSPLRATSEYRDHLAEVLLKRVLNTAFERAKLSLNGK